MLIDLNGGPVIDADITINVLHNQSSSLSAMEELFLGEIDEIRARVGWRVPLSTITEDTHIPLRDLRKLLKKYDIRTKSVGDVVYEYREEIQEMVALKIEDAKIARWLGCSEGVIQRFKKRYKPSRIPLSACLREIEARIRWRVPLEIIADDFNVSKQAVWEMAQKNGIQTLTTEQFLENYSELIELMITIHFSKEEICGWLGVTEKALCEFLQEKPFFIESKEQEKFIQEYLFLNDIFRMRTSGILQKNIAEKWNVTQPYVSYLLRQKKYNFNEWNTGVTMKPTTP